MHRPGKPPAFLVATTKLQHEWSANRGVPHISSDWLDELLSDHRFGEINSMVKIRLLLAGLLAVDQTAGVASSAASSRDASGPAAQQQRAAERAELQRALQRLRTAVASDADEWDKVMSAAAGPMDGRLDLEAVMQQSQAVGDTYRQQQQGKGKGRERHRPV